jgi:tRNA pseudouridine65 synthase
MAFTVLHSDARIVAIRKPAGIHVHPTPLSPGEPAVLGLLRAQLGEDVLPVHRLDRPTSGILVFARDRAAAAALGAAFAGREAEKTYWALARGWTAAAFEADSPVADEDGGPARPARTAFRLLERHELPWPLGKHPTVRTSLVEARPETGRRHQIRRHLARAAHPIIGDYVWGCRHHNHRFAAEFGACSLQLFAVAIRLPHPDGGWLDIRDEPARPDARVLEAVRRHRLAE